ncbi:MAG: helix-turn-helix domain-containing protein [Treponema sp.]|jgi:AraC-like DNA-binding protein|nr:helix-turn-helix domain-containing protein [Treponema sp.]
MLKLQPGNTGKNRDTGPLLSKAGTILTTYEKAADCVVSVIDPGSKTLILNKDMTAGSLCSYCCKNPPDSENDDLPGDFPCENVHQNAIEESRKLGSSYIYMCPLGLVFWVSPLYSGGHYAGALMAGNVLGISREEALSRVQSCCSGTVTADQIKADLEKIPQRSYEEIKALAQMMLICAQQVSAGIGTIDVRGSRYFEPDTVDAAVSGENGKLRDSEFSAAESEAVKAPEPAERPLASRLQETAQPSSDERLLIASLRRGDGAAARRILEDIFDGLKSMRPGDLHFLRCRAIELVVLLSRSCTAEKKNDHLLEENNLYLKKINDSVTVDELQVNLCRIVERMAGRIFSFHGLRHASALRRAERFIWKNYTRKVSLEEIASASGLSAPYFSTIFREEMGEHLSSHLNRLRVEKACAMLLETKTTLNEISESCGFEDQSWFSKIFKSYTGYSPGKYREQGGINGYSLDNYHAG